MSSIFQAIIDFSKLDYSIVAVFVSVLAFYIPTMKNRREKAYYDFFYVESFGRFKSDNNIQPGYLGAGLMMIVIVFVSFWLRLKIALFFVRIIFYSLLLCVISIYCYVVYYNPRPEKQELRRWLIADKKAQIFIWKYRTLEHVMTMLALILTIELTYKTQNFLSVIFVILCISHFYTSCMDYYIIRRTLGEYTREIAYIEKNENKYAIISSDNNMFYCLPLVKREKSAVLHVDCPVLINWSSYSELIIKRMYYDSLIRMYRGDIEIDNKIIVKREKQNGSRKTNKSNKC